MLVEDADRYGISQLHQLRGRIGRGEHPSVCLLFGAKDSPRLRALAAHADGFELAEIDLRAARRGRARRDPAARPGAVPGGRAAARRRAARARAPARRGDRAEDPDLDAARARAAGRRAGAALRRPRRRRRSAREGVIAGSDSAGGRWSRRAGGATRPTSIGSARHCSRSSAGRRARGCSTCSRDRARWASRRCRAAPPGHAGRLLGGGYGGDPAQPGALGAEAEVRRQRRARFPRAGTQRARQYDLVFVDPPYRHAATSAVSSRRRCRRCSHRTPASSPRATGGQRCSSSCRCSTSAATATP